MKRRHIITIKDLARELQVSVATVSRGLRNTHDVSEITRSKILAKAKELNFRPNFNAMGLVNNKSHNIAVILPTITHYYFAEVISGIQKVAYKNNFNIILHITGESAEREIAIARQLPLSSIDGLLVSVTSDSQKCDHFLEIFNCGVPIVFFDRVADSINTSKVMQNDFEGAFIAVERLIENGYKKIAHITGPYGPSLTRHRFDGYLAALKKHNLAVWPEWIIYSEFEQSSGSDDVKQLWESKNKPNAIFAVNDSKAIGAMLELKRRNIEIGKEVAVAGFTNEPMSAVVSPSLTTFEEPAMEIGMRSCELLLQHISKKDFTPKQVVINGKLIVRESSGKRLVESGNCFI